VSSTLNPARSKLDLALSEFSKARLATEPSIDAPLQPTDLDLVVRPPSSLGKQASFALTRFLIAFCIGVAATLAWQSYGDAVRKMTASSSPRLVGSSAPRAAPEAATRGIEAGGFVVQLSAQRYQSGVLIVGTPTAISKPATCCITVVEFVILVLLVQLAIELQAPQSAPVAPAPEAAPAPAAPVAPAPAHATAGA
jgi:hypothetical protein